VDDRAPRILIVDNDADSAALARLHLESEGFRVEVSEGGSGAALWLAQTFRPWVALVRHDLPVTDGLEVCRLMKADMETSHVSLILSCARALDDRVTVRALEAGASLVLGPSSSGQPWSREVLLAHVYAQMNNFQMVMELREKNHFLRDLVQRDPMTGLFNHAYLHELLDRELSRASRGSAQVSVLLIDLDHFKDINDTHGHQAGDYVLKTAAALFSQGGRRSDAVARCGGDEFAVVLPETGRAGAAVRAEAVRTSMQSRAFSERRLPGVTLSIGIATYPDDATESGPLLAAADRALYAAKRIGRNRVVSYRADLGGPDAPSAESGVELERLLAISDVVQKRLADFVYQPILSAETGAVFAQEALCRPRLAAFPDPVTLFATAESAGRVAELGRVLRTLSVAPLAQLPPPALLFLNLHPLELSEDLVEEALTVHAEWAGRIVFEVTESSQIHDYDRRRGIIGRLQDAGFRVAVDDLGAGYAGLNSVAMLRPDFVKLDMTLIRGIQRDTSAARLVRHILDFAAGEGMLVVAEGVETAEERRVVMDLGCPLLQGDYFAPPGPPFPEVKSLNAWLSRRSTPASQRARRKRA
jgi:diguanylate cyclase (GGDEF)-like protein